MKLITNTIRTGKAKTFEDIVSDYGKAKEALVKTASVVKTADDAVVTETVTETVTKTEDEAKAEETSEEEKDASAETETKEAKKKLPDALKEHQFKKKDAKDTEDKEAEEEVEIKIAAEEKDEADSSGQLDVEPLHQKGESTPKIGKPKESGGSAPPAKAAAEKDEADSSKQPEWEGKKEHNNDPEAGKHREGDGDQKKSEAAEEEIKEASKCSCCDKKCKSCKDCKSCKSCKAARGCLASDKSETKTAATEMPRFVKVANLNDKSKTWLRKYWRNLYPEAYVEAMLADK